MSTTGLIGVYRPGTTVLHRLTPGAKLIGLFAFSVTVVVVRGPWSALAFLGVALAMAAIARMPLRTTLRTLRGFAVVAAMLLAFNAWQNGWASAVEVVADLLALILAATALTATTAVDDLLDTITRSLEPFRRLGVDPDRVALAFSLTLRAIPGTLELAAEARDAARARGLDRSIRARTTPLVVRAVARARATGDALHARGIAD